MWEWSDVVLAGSILATAAAAWWQMRRHRQIAALRATIDLVVHQEIHNPEWIRLSVAADSVLQNEKQWDLLFDEDARDLLSQEKMAAVLTVLNHYEIVAVAISSAAIDEDLYRKWKENAYIAAWDRSRRFVAMLRAKRDSPQLLCEFEALSARWLDQRNCRDSSPR